MDSADSFARADKNLLASMRAMARWQGEAELVEDGALLLVSGRRRFPGGYSNCAARLDLALPAAKVLERAAAFFVERGRGFTLFVREPIDDDLLEASRAAGLVVSPRMPWMVLEHAAEPPPLPEGVTLRWCQDVAGVDDAVAVCADAYPSVGLPEDIVRSLFAAPERALADGARIVVAYNEGRAAATAMLLATDEVAGVYWVATRPDARGRRLAEACTAQVVAAGLAAGARFAVLQASVMGAPVYARMGFRTEWNLSWLVVTREVATKLAG
jgi:hypothetical protein